MIDFDTALAQTETRKGPQSHLALLLAHLEQHAPEQHAKVVAALRSRMEQTNLARVLTLQAQSIDGLLPRPTSRIEGASVKVWRMSNGVES